tara:strand:- start:17493 stop:18737 length:1245 start_codon:yes stop_codon:yes gene_type:complete
LKKLNICVVGLGYVGTPLLIELRKKGFNAFGVDIDKSRIQNIKASKDNHGELDFESLEILKPIVASEFESLDDQPNVYIVTVPTPIDKENIPDLEPLISCSAAISFRLNEGDLVIYESTVYPGTTEEICVPILEQSGLKLGVNFSVGYSPERLSPGLWDKNINEVVKVVSASDDKALEVVKHIYQKAIDAGIYVAESIKVAEASKVTENIQRDVNIALINELYMLYESLGINTNQVLNAASSKYNFHRYYQGLVGGHCIGVDPYYLIHKSKLHLLSTQLIETAREINESLTGFLADQILVEIENAGLRPSDINLLFVGATFKEDCADIRNSKSLDLINLLQKKGLVIDVFDPLIKEDIRGLRLITSSDELKKNYDSIFFSVCHQEIYNLGINFFKKIHSGTLKIFDYKRVITND